MAGDALIASLTDSMYEGMYHQGVRIGVIIIFIGGACALFLLVYILGLG
jgi:hypothetical protein